MNLTIAYAIQILSSMIQPGGNTHVISVTKRMYESVTIIPSSWPFVIVVRRVLSCVSQL